MKKPRVERDGPVKVPLPFDEAIQRVLQVKPPPGGWKAFDREGEKRRRRTPKPTAG